MEVKMNKLIIFLVIIILAISLSACDMLNIDIDKIKDTIGTIENIEEKVDDLQSKLDDYENILPIGDTAVPTDEKNTTTEVDPTSMLYINNAYMRGYDTSTHLASFDFFEMYYGEDAIEKLIINHGYSRTEAENEINNWVEGEFYTHDDGLPARVVSLDTVDISLLYDRDGNNCPSFPLADPVSTEDVNALYALNKEILINYTYYNITIDQNGDIVSIEQIYTP